jgi:Spy/CpxP family protein refolding chaperone
MLGKSKLKVWMVGGALLAMSGLAIAAGPGFGRGNNPNCPGGFDQLNLTAEQKTKLTDLREKTWKDTVDLRNEMQAKRLELRTLWTDPKSDKDQIQAKQKEMNDLRNKLQAKMTDSRLEARKHLTPEQAAQMAACGPGLGLGFGGGGMHRMGRMGCGNCDGPGGAGFGPGGGPGKGPGQGGGRL